MLDFFLFQNWHINSETQYGKKEYELHTVIFYEKEDFKMTENERDDWIICVNDSCVIGAEMLRFQGSEDDAAQKKMSDRFLEKLTKKVIVTSVMQFIIRNKV